MGKKMILPFPFKSSSSETPPSWPWPSACTAPKTMSFRENHDIFKTVNSAFLDASNSKEFVETSKACFNGSNVLQESCSTGPEIIPDEDDDEEDEEKSIETVIRGLKSERLFFEPENKNIVQESSCLTMSVDSTDPFDDFKKSMEEMVEAHGLKDWECLEELLSCYLEVNCKSNHGYIISAFVDMLVGFVFASNSPSSYSAASSSRNLLPFSSSSTTNSFTSPLSFSSSTFSTSPGISSLEVDDEKSVNNNIVTTSSPSVSSSSAPV